MSEHLTDRPHNGEGDDIDERTGLGEATKRSSDAPEADPTVRVIDRRWWARSEDSDDGKAGQSDKPSYVEELENRLAEKDKLLADYAARYKAAANEFDGTRARLRKEVAKDVERETRRILTSFLEVSDNLDRAIDAARDAAADNPGALSVLQGVEMVRQQFLATLSTFGVQPIDVAGQSFDPNLHDAIATVPVTETEREDLVIDVIKPGYMIDDDILRPAAVTVGKLAPATE